MKIAFKLAKANMNIAAIQMENSPFLVSDILPLLNPNGFAISCDGTDVIIYLNINKLVQAAGSYTGGVFTSTSTFQRLDNDETEGYINFQPNVTVAKFVKGTTYLIDTDVVAPLPMIPNMSHSFIVAGVTAGSDLENFRQTKFLFDCDQDTEIMNATSISSCITVQRLGANVAAANAVRTLKKATEVYNFALATGDVQTARLVQNDLLRLTQG